MRAAQSHRVDRALRDVELQPVRAGDIAHDRPRAVVERDRQRHCVWGASPDRCLAAVRFLHICRRVVAPAHRDRQLAACPGHEEAQSDRGWEERLARRLALVVRLLGQAGRFWHGVEVVVLVGISAPVGRRPGRDQEAGDVPVRRAFAARQLLGAELMVRPGSNQIELDGLYDARADFEGLDRSAGGGSHWPGGYLTRSRARWSGTVVSFQTGNYRSPTTRHPVTARSARAPAVPVSARQRLVQRRERRIRPFGQLLPG